MVCVSQPVWGYLSFTSTYGGSHAWSGAWDVAKLPNVYRHSLCQSVKHTTDHWSPNALHMWRCDDPSAKYTYSKGDAHRKSFGVSNHQVWPGNYPERIYCDGLDVCRRIILVKETRMGCCCLYRPEAKPQTGAWRTQDGRPRHSPSFF